LGKNAIPCHVPWLTPVIPTTLGRQKLGAFWFEASLGKNTRRPYLKNNKARRAGSMVPVAEHLLASAKL
jgi:hypothetical protein